MTAGSLEMLMAGIEQAIVTLTMLAVPHLAHRDLLFGVPVPPGFRSTEAGREALRSYRLWVAIPAGVGLLGLMLLPKPWLIAPEILSIVVLGLVAFVKQNRKLKPFAIQPPPIRQTELGAPERLPWFTWLGILPLLFLAGVAWYLHAHWDQIPVRYPVHFDITGTPNRWTDRSARGVYGFLVLGGEFVLFLFGMTLAGWYGSRRSEPMRKPAMVVMIAAGWMLALVFGQIPLQTAGGFHIPILWMVFGPLVVLIPSIAYAVHESNKPRDPIDPTPNECWKGGMIYYNPNDAALFVQRRDSMGFTINFGNRWSWALYGGLLFVLASGALMMRVLS